MTPNCAFARSGRSRALSSSPPTLTNLTGTTITPVASGLRGPKLHPDTRDASASILSRGGRTFDIIIGMQREGGALKRRAGYCCFAGGLVGTASMYTD